MTFFPFFAAHSLKRTKLVPLALYLTLSSPAALLSRQHGNKRII